MNIKKIPALKLQILAILTLITPSFIAAANKPQEIVIGITTFLSGPASVFGIPAKMAAELYLEQLNERGGIQGVPVRPIFIDEGLGAPAMLAEYQRVVKEEQADAMLSAISSGHCMALGPVAEDLKVVNLMWDCGTERAIEGHDFKYVVRPQANAVTEMVASVLYLLKVHPDFKTIAVVNQDYAWGHDSWAIFRAALKQLKPEVTVVAELFPQFGAPNYSFEVSRLQVLKPDVVLSTAWGGDLDTFVTQAAQRGLLRSMVFFLPLGESSLERLGNRLPEGVLIGARGDHYFLHPQYLNDPKHQEFVTAFHDKTNSYPIYPVYHMVQALEALVGAYDAALTANNLHWPNKEEIALALRGLSFRGLTGTVTIRPEDGQGLESQLFGVTTVDSAYNFRILKDIALIPALSITTPAGEISSEWLKTLTPDLLETVEFYPNNNGEQP